MQGASSWNTSVILNEGKGDFAPPVAVGPSGAYAVGDLNGDGWPDLAIGGGDNAQTLTLNIVLNQGNGTFAAPIAAFVMTSKGVAVGWSWLAMGDLNDDGHTDIAFIDGDSNVHVLLNAGDGVTFAAAVPHAVGNATGLVAVGDLNRDGKLDIVVSSTTGWPAPSACCSGTAMGRSPARSTTPFKATRRAWCSRT
jgi:hypothetical protein